MSGSVKWPPTARVRSCGAGRRCSGREAAFQVGKDVIGAINPASRTKQG